jgi:hypothetical protein
MLWGMVYSLPLPFAARFFKETTSHESRCVPEKETMPKEESILFFAEC